MNQNHLIGEFNLPFNITVMFSDEKKINISINLKVLIENFELFKEKTQHDPNNLSAEMVATYFSRSREIQYKVRAAALEYDSSDKQILEQLKDRFSELLSTVLADNGIKLMRFDKLNLLSVINDEIDRNNKKQKVVIVKRTGKAPVVILSVLLIILVALFIWYYLQTFEIAILNDLPFGIT